MTRDFLNVIPVGVIVTWGLAELESRSLELISEGEPKNYTVSTIRTYVIAATTQCKNHYTITA